MQTTRLYPECIRCLLNKNLTRYPADAAPEQQTEYMRRVLTILADAPLTEGAPVLTRAFKYLRAEMFGIQEEFAEIKRHFNALMLTHEADMEQAVKASDDPLSMALRYALTGNYIDFGAGGHKVSDEELERLLKTADELPLNENTLADFRDDLSRAKKLVYITDNCGEIVADKVLLRTIARVYPDIESTVLVRGGDVLNDATMTDALQVGLEKIAPVVGNGNDVAGTYWQELSDEARTLLEEADVIFSKGQANFETLHGCGRNVYYLFMCKCELFANRFKAGKLGGMFLRDKDD